MEELQFLKTVLSEVESSKMQEVQLKHLQLILEILDSKNRSGVRLVRQENKIMLILDKSKLNKINQRIINTITMVYPNNIVCINNEKSPFDYDEIYKLNKTKPNIKVRPYKVYEFTIMTDKSAIEYFEQYPFAGIELDITKLDAVMQLGYFLEFIYALQEQNPLEMQDIETKKGVEVYTPEQLRRYEHYTKQGRPDLSYIFLNVEYNEEINEFNTELELKNDPYFYRKNISFINRESPYTTRKEVTVKITPERLKNNVCKYIEDKKKEKTEASERQIAIKPKEIQDKENLIGQ